MFISDVFVFVLRTLLSWAFTKKFAQLPLITSLSVGFSSSVYTHTQIKKNAEKFFMKLLCFEIFRIFVSTFQFWL